jgi:hypothetical protein
MNGVQHYVDWGVLHISVANLIVILLMILIFALAVLLPFPGGSGSKR